MQPKVAIHAVGNSFAFAKFMQSNYMNWLRHELIFSKIMNFRYAQ